eukprot:scaffold163203_cov53-Attheya_sp.AAC.6
MGKTTKRARKFTAKGGIKGSLEKGSVTKKGKLKMKRRTKPGSKPDNHMQENADAAEREDARKKKRDDQDFVGDENLGELDMESFFKTVAEENDSDDDNSDEEESVDSNEDMEDDDDSDAVDSDIDEENLEEAEKAMKLELDKLQSSDPDFHKYLKENEKSLLEFGEEDDDEEEDDDDDMEEEEGDDDSDDDIDPKEKKSAPKERKTEEKESPVIVLTPELLKTFEQSAFRSHGLKGLRRIISAYKNACHLADSSQDNETSGASPNKRVYQIESSVVFDRLMVVCLSKCHEEFHYHLLGKGSGKEVVEKKDEKASETEEIEDEAFDENKGIHPKSLSKSRRWADLKLVVQSFLKSTLHLLSEAKEPKLLNFIVKSFAHYIPYLTAYPRIATAMLKALVSLWSAPLDSSEDYQVVRLNAFLRIRQMAVTQPFPFIEQCLRSTYLAYAKRAKFGTAASVTSVLPTLTFMGNCIVELYGLDYQSSYQHAFVYIRQLALHLRTALQKRTPETFRVVYCWQYLHCLKVWVAVLSSSAQNSSVGDDEASLLRSLIYPLTEVIFGTARLVPTTRHLPLRLHCVRLIQQLAASAQLYIPTTSILLDVFDLKEVYMKPKRVPSNKGSGGADIKGVRLPLILKLPKEGTLRTTEQLDACLSETFVLLNREVDLYRYSAGFPEFSVWICQRMRKFSKETKNGRWRAFGKGCIEICERHAAEAVKARMSLLEAPKDVKRLEALKPPTAPSMLDRYEVSIAKEKRLEAASQPVVSSKTIASSKNKIEEEKQEPRKKLTSREKKQKKKLIPAIETDLKNTGALQEDDEVEEGIDWSDSDDEMDE